MKNYFKVAGILGLITCICAALIALMNMVTSPIISKNDEETAKETYSLIFADYDHSLTPDWVPDEDGYITDVIEAYDADDNFLGYIYTTDGKNAYGEISLMIGIANNTVVDVEFLTNTESFASSVNTGLKNNYPSSKDDITYIGWQPEDNGTVGALSSEDIQAISDKMSTSSKTDVTAGATYGAKTVNAMVAAALKNAIENAKGAE